MITVNGFGSVTPNLNGQLLELGASYTVTAVPGTSTTFTGWSGGLTSANVALTFAMQPGLSLQANFATNPPPDTTAPTIVFTSPAANSRFNDAAIVVRGTAGDNVAVTRVDCQLNSGPFQPATGTTNWSAALTLAPGTNVVRVQSFDSAGNQSAVVSRTFVYAPVSGLTLRVNGHGSVTPDLNGQLLEIGATYSLMATPDAGFSFAGWTGDVPSTNSTTLVFTMQPDLVIWANFADLTAPTVTIAAPAADTRFTNAMITVQGTASDNVKVDWVECQVDSGPLQTASGTTNWSATVALALGTNTLSVRSFDSSLNQSAVATRRFVYAPVSPLTVRVNGSGVVTPDLNGHVLEIGSSYTLTATPAAGHSFNGWSGDVTSPNAVLTFVMQPNMTLQANFSDASAPLVAFTSPAAGAKFTNATITIQGTASDNLGVARVSYQLNAGPFLTASGTTNWSASVTLATGTNTVRVKSIDGTGLESALISRAFVYAPVSPLTVAVNGNGSVTPTLNGQFLEVGARYTLTAVPAAGFAFTGWSGDVSGTNATLTFVMQANLTIVANFADATAPTVAFTSPPANARLTNAWVNVEGTASDNIAVSRVDYQLNAAPFMTASGTTNWSVSLNLPLGTNVVRVKSFDNAGNVSAVVSRSLVYAPVSLLTATVSGNGNVSPNLNGQLLDIGTSYTMTATAATGHSFAGWSGGLTSTNATLNFVMQPGLTLRANFTDATAPSIAITSPAAGARFTNSAITLQGTASDNVGVARVEYQLNAAPFAVASGTTNWLVSLTLAAGTNTVRIKSIDGAGNTSALVTRSFVYAPVGLLSLTINGNGSVTPNLNGQWLELGASYTLTAVPAAGFVFAGWSGGASSTNATLTFTMQPGLAPVANFSDGTAPTVTFTSPAENTRVNSAALTIQGTASDNAAVARVEYQVNSGAFQIAVGTTTWTTTITLSSGTNIVRVRSVDNLGNTSAVVARSFIYAPANALLVTVTGRGSVVPDLNGQLLEIGATYTVTAVPAAGFAFGSWTGGVAGENPVMTFTMHANLVLEANFYDTGAPMIAITAPAANARFTNSAMTLEGNASDSGGVDRVEYQLGTGPFQVANGTTNWSASIVLAPGTNTVRVKAIDSGGIESVVAARNFVYAPSSRVTITVNGSGSVTPDLDGQLLEIGASYTIGATPAPGNVFSGWSGGATGTNAVLTFTMQPGLTLAANFTAAPTNANTNSLVSTNYLGLAKGLYTGLFYEEQAVQHHSSGFFTLTSTERGRYTASMRTAGRTWALSGRFTAEGKATNVIRRTGTNALIVELQLRLGSEVGTLTGQITDGAWVASLLAERMTFHAITNPAPFAGKYTMVIPGNNDSSVSPGGDGYGTVAVSASGYASFSGTLGDGLPTVSQRVPLTKNGLWPLYASLYSGKGSLMSWMRFADRPTDDLNGLLSWIKPSLPATKFYPGGFTNETFALGSLYTPPATRTNRVLNISNGLVEFSGANLASAFTEEVLLASTNKVFDLGSARLTMNFAFSSGQFRGSVVNPENGKLITFKGAVLQKANVGFGMHSGTNRTGRVSFFE
jgi:uncharacterized repeat protein (TIGR02543 family)